VQKALEVNDPKKKEENQITDETRNDPSSTGRTIDGKKDTQTVNESEERKDFPEITTTAMSDFICNKCGKSFQNQDNLFRHMNLEEGKEKGREISEKSRMDRQRTVPINPKRTLMRQEDTPSGARNLLPGKFFSNDNEEVLYKTIILFHLLLQEHEDFGRDIF
jgi:uncharacterized C2H2 Zn-finger protein